MTNRGLQTAGRSESDSEALFEGGLQTVLVCFDVIAKLPAQNQYYHSTSRGL